MSTAHAEAKATALIDKFGIEDAPVPVEQVARWLGAEVVYRAFEGDVSGMVYRNDKEKVIGVNSSHPPNRQRFTVAHEIGHLILHKGQHMYVDSFGGRVNWRDGARDKAEAEANAFAAELLMPRIFVERAVALEMEHPPASPKQLVTTMARRFRVSQLSMQFRLENLGILDPGGLLS
jgi:Zn-dependent peptidase ImmA (M78 family)